MQGRLGARVASLQGSILRGDIKTLWRADYHVNYSIKLCLNIGLVSGNPRHKTYEIIAENANPRLTTPIGGTRSRLIGVKHVPMGPSGAPGARPQIQKLIKSSPEPLTAD